MLFLLPKTYRLLHFSGAGEGLQAWHRYFLANQLRFLFRFRFFLSSISLEYGDFNQLRNAMAWVFDLLVSSTNRQSSLLIPQTFFESSDDSSVPDEPQSLSLCAVSCGMLTTWNRIHTHKHKREKILIIYKKKQTMLFVERHTLRTCDIHRLIINSELNFKKKCCGLYKLTGKI